MSTKYEKYISRREMIGNKELIILDNLFSAKQITKAYEILQALPYELNDVDTPETDYARHWKAEFDTKDITGMMFFGRIIKIAKEIYAEHNFKLSRVHSNLHLYGDLQFPHIDSINGLTAVYYANHIWEEKWMGETVFYSDSREPLFVVAPKPGRLILFSGNIIHRSGVPTRECFEPRITLAFKFSK